MRRRILRIALVALMSTFSLAAIATVRAPSAHAALPCYSTYQQVTSDSGWWYTYTLYGYVRDDAQVVVNFDSATHAVCSSFGKFQMYISQSLNQCYYTADWNYTNDSTTLGGSFNTSKCYITYTAYSGYLPKPNRCLDAHMWTNVPGDSGASAVWCV